MSLINNTRFQQGLDRVREYIDSKQISGDFFPLGSNFLDLPGSTLSSATTVGGYRIPPNSGIIDLPPEFGDNGGIMFVVNSRGTDSELLRHRSQLLVPDASESGLGWNLIGRQATWEVGATVPPVWSEWYAARQPQLPTLDFTLVAEDRLQLHLTDSENGRVQAVGRANYTIRADGATTSNSNSPAVDLFIEGSQQTGEYFIRFQDNTTDGAISNTPNWLNLENSDIKGGTLTVDFHPAAPSDPVYFVLNNVSAIGRSDWFSLVDTINDIQNVLDNHNTRISALESGLPEEAITHYIRPLSSDHLLIDNKNILNSQQFGEDGFIEFNLMKAGTAGSGDIVVTPQYENVTAWYVDRVKRWEERIEVEAMLSGPQIAIAAHDLQPILSAEGAVPGFLAIHAVPDTGFSATYYLPFINSLQVVSDDMQYIDSDLALVGNQRIYGEADDGTLHEMLGINFYNIGGTPYDQQEVGSMGVPLNFNGALNPGATDGKARPTMDTPSGKEDIAFLGDIIVDPAYLMSVYTDLYQNALVGDLQLYCDKPIIIKELIGSPDVTTYTLRLGSGFRGSNEVKGMLVNTDLEVMFISQDEVYTKTVPFTDTNDRDYLAGELELVSGEMVPDFYLVRVKIPWAFPTPNDVLGTKYLTLQAFPERVIQNG